MSVPWHQSLAWRFFLRTALIILALTGSVLWVARQQSRKQALLSAQAGIRVSAQVMERTFESQAMVMDAGLEVFTHTRENLAGVREEDFSALRESLLQNLANLKSDVAMVIRPSGALLSCTTDGAKQDYSDVGIVALAQHPDLAARQGQPGPAYRGYFRIEEGTYRGLYHGVARRFEAPGGALLGVMVVATRIGDATAMALRDQAMVLLKAGDPSGHVALLCGRAVAGSTFTRPGDLRAVTDWVAGPAGEAARDTLARQPMTSPILIRLDGQDHLGMLCAMQGSAPGLELAELVTVPLAPFLRPFHRVQEAILWVGLLAVGLGLGLALRTARTITAPLAGLTRAMAALAEGDRPELPPAPGRDEVGDLSRAFRTLLAELKAKDELLQALEQIRSAQGHQTSAPGLTLPAPEDTIMLDATDDSRTQGTGTEPGPQALPLHKGDRLADRYRVERILGSGGMGVVLKARDEKLEEDVALKLIRPELGGNAIYLEQLKQEIKLARRISHRHVLRTHDFGEAEGRPFVTMEYLHGVTLRQLMDGQPSLPLPLVLRIGRQVAEGLEAAHQEGVVHRDIKPQNIMFNRRGDVKIMDFGLAAPLEEGGADAQGQIFGTPRYMAPEQVRGEPVDLRTDLYALGVLLFEMSTGAPPFEAPGVAQVLRLHLVAPAPDVRSLNPDLPEPFSRLIHRLLAKDKADRPGEAGTVAALLSELSETEGTASTGPAAGVLPSGSLFND